MSFMEEVAFMDAELREEAETVDKLGAYIESAYNELMVNYKKSELKVVQESGEQTDLDYLYEQAELTFKERIAKAWAKIVVSILGLVQKITKSDKVAQAAKKWDEKYKSYNGNATVETEDLEEEVKATEEAVDKMGKIINFFGKKTKDVEKEIDDQKENIDKASKKKKRRACKNVKKEMEDVNKKVDDVTKKAEKVANDLNSKKPDENIDAEEATAVSKAAQFVNQITVRLNSLKNKIAGVFTKADVEILNFEVGDGKTSVVDEYGNQLTKESAAMDFLEKLDAMLESGDDMEIPEDDDSSDDADETDLEESVDAMRDHVLDALEDGVINEESAINMLKDLDSIMESTDEETTYEESAIRVLEAIDEFLESVSYDEEDIDVTMEGSEEEMEGEEFEERTSIESLEDELGISGSFFEEAHPLESVGSYVAELAEMQEEIFCEWEACDSLLDELDYIIESENAIVLAGDSGESAKATETKKKGIIRTVWNAIIKAFNKLYTFITEKLNANWFANLSREMGDKKFVVKYDIDKVIEAGNAIENFINSNLMMKGGTIKDQEAKLAKLDELCANLKEVSSKKEKSILTVSNIEAKVNNIKNATKKGLDDAEKYSKGFTKAWAAMIYRFGEDNLTNPQKNYPLINSKVSDAYKLIQTTYNAMVTYLIRVLPRKERKQYKEEENN